MFSLEERGTSSAPSLTQQKARDLQIRPAGLGSMEAPYLMASPSGPLLRIKVQPRARANQIVGVLGNELKIKISAPPVDSKANEELIEFLAAQLELGKNSIQLVKGSTSTHKVISIRGLSADEVIARMAILVSKN
jgi:uncharacterized protein (TIGR00251 family)